MKAMIEGDKGRSGKTLSEADSLIAAYSDVPGGQESVNEFRELVTVSTFENGGRGDVDLVQPFSEFREIFLVERHLDQRIARVSIETSRNEKKIRLEF